MFNEFGLGGGMSECGDTPGTDYKIGLFPWLGVTTSYEASKDPFKASPAAKSFLIDYYQAALRLLKTGGGAWPVHHSYIWNCVSWDVQVRWAVVGAGVAVFEYRPRLPQQARQSAAATSAERAASDARVQRTLTPLPRCPACLLSFHSSHHHPHAGHPHRVCAVEHCD
jgi:hypothetical protein